MNKFKPWKDELLSLVELGVRQFGFGTGPDRQTFSKKCTFGRVDFHLAFIIHQDDFDVTADVGIRFDQVEELVYRDDTSLTQSQKDETCTIGCELGNLSEGRQKRWTIHTADDLSVAADGIVSNFKSAALPYVEKFSDATHVLNVLSSDGCDSWLHSPIDVERAKRAVAMALITQGNQPAQRLANSKESYLKQRKDLGVSTFHAFLKTLGLT